MNTASPSKKNPVFILDDEDENTIEFATEKEANDWIRENKRSPFGYAVVCVEDLEFTYW